MIKTYLLALSTALLLSTATVSIAATDISGTYDCKGHAPGGQEYTDGVLKVTKSDSLYNFDWTFASEKSHTTGSGVYNNEDDSSVAVLFTIQKPTPKETGVIIYKISGNTIKGTAILQGKKLLGGETCTKK